MSLSPSSVPQTQQTRGRSGSPVLRRPSGLTHLQTPHLEPALRCYPTPRPRPRADAAKGKTSLSLMTTAKVKLPSATGGELGGEYHYFLQATAGEASVKVTTQEVRSALPCS